MERTIIRQKEEKKWQINHSVTYRWLVGWLVGFKAYQPFSGHLTPNQFQTIQFSISIGFEYKKIVVKTVQLNVKTVLFQTTQFSISTPFNSI